MAEQWTLNPLVLGSNPRGRTNRLGRRRCVTITHDVTTARHRPVGFLRTAHVAHTVVVGDDCASNTPTGNNFPNASMGGTT